MLADSFFYYLVLVGFAAGLMDAAVGGGGLLQIPGLFNLLPNATPVASVMGVNKFASCCGTLTATGQYLRRIPVPWKMLLPAAALVIMIAMCLYTFLKKDLGQTVRTEKLTRRETLWGLFFGALIGFYDGVFGPGTGSLLAFVFVRFYGYDFLAANASAKVINSTTNLAALTFFIPQGHVVWAWAIPLAVANLCGGVVGARLAMRGGTRLLRYGFMLLLCLTIGKFAWDLLG